MEGPGHRKITRRKGACFACRQRKVRCDGLPICSQCVKLCLKCAYNPGTLSQNDRPRSVSMSIGDGVEPQTSRSGARPRFGTGIDPLSPVQSQAKFTHNLDGFLLNSNPTMSGALWEPGTGISNDFTTPATSPNELPSLDYFTSSENDHPQDQNITFRDDYSWNRSWSKDLCSDFSSLAPLRILGNFMENISTDYPKWSSQRSLWVKLQRFSYSQVTGWRPQSSKGSLSYTQREVLEFVDCKKP
ncbi:hypothetical protein BKA66DRAFT_45269 [Pyrenochaeta sp. MPI-SDFR-AT-0127]|nr:hypothetical protein BKA66DRAFT_45269 [Pyrenochaeta sp. MPI-SDFR-AT-0127]